MLRCDVSVSLPYLFHFTSHPFPFGLDVDHNIMRMEHLTLPQNTRDNHLIPQRFQYPVYSSLDDDKTPMPSNTNYCRTEKYAGRLKSGYMNDTNRSYSMFKIFGDNAGNKMLL